jgi:phospholipase C
VLLVVVYDENGGYFDHVPPPRTADARPEFGQLGFRVPAFVVGPTVWSGGVVSTQLEHASVAATLGTRFGIESLGIRMDAANDLSSCIDPAKVGRPVAAAPRLFPVELSSQDVTQALATPTSQSEMHDLLRSGAVPAQMVDGRSTNDRFRSWLRHAQELEAVKVRS